MTDTKPWIEKYRPNHFNNIVLEPMNREIFQNIITTGYFPNLIFYGPPGTGKTTTIINLINSYQMQHFRIDKSLVIHLNASDERGIDIVRNQIYTFVKSSNMFYQGTKFVILDEVDYMTKNAQQALKYLLQICGDNVKFCLICNYISKIDESLQNEFICVRFNQLPRNEIITFIKGISEKENIKMSDNVIKAIQSIYKSDIRSMINFIQLNQNLDFSKWKYSVLNNQVFEQIHLYLNGGLSGNENGEEVLYDYLHNISIQYNIDKKAIIQKYFDFIIRDAGKRELVTRRFLNLVKSIVHCNDVKNDDIVNYFCCHMRSYYSAL